MFNIFNSAAIYFTDNIIVLEKTQYVVSPCFLGVVDANNRLNTRSLNTYAYTCPVSSHIINNTHGSNIGIRRHDWALRFHTSHIPPGGIEEGHKQKHISQLSTWSKQTNFPLQPIMVLPLLNSHNILFLLHISKAHMVWNAAFIKCHRIDINTHKNITDFLEAHA